MEDSELKWKRKVFRLRGLPSHIATCSAVARLLSSALEDIPESDIKVASLAKTVEWEKPHSKIATLQLKSLPAFFRSKLDDEEWDLSNCVGVDRLILDCHFLGLTPLNDVDRNVHVAEFVSIHPGPGELWC